MNTKLIWRADVAVLLRAVLVVMMVVLASGCATVVYKEGATTFVSAGRAVGKGLAEASANLAAAEDAVKLSKIVTDASCPIAEARLFVRPTGPITTKYSTLLARFPTRASESECIKLVQCDGGHVTDQACRSACYSREEAYCLVNLEKDYAIEIGKQTEKSTVDAALSKNADLLSANLKKTEYGRAAPLESKVIGASLQVLMQYLDLLAKVAEDRKSEIPDDAKKLSNELKQATDGFAKATGTQLSADFTAQRTKVQNGIGALGKFLGTVDLMVDQSQDVKELRTLINQHKDAVPLLVDAIRPIFDGDANLIAALNDRANYSFRQNLEKRFELAKDEYERRQLVGELSKYPVGSGKALMTSVNKIFDAVLKSHNTLLTLINNPTDEQIKRIRSEEFNTFRGLVEDATALLALL